MAPLLRPRSNGFVSDDVHLSELHVPHLRCSSSSCRSSTLARAGGLFGAELHRRVFHSARRSRPRLFHSCSGSPSLPLPVFVSAVAASKGLQLCAAAFIQPEGNTQPLSSYLLLLSLSCRLTPPDASVSSISHVFYRTDFPHFVRIGA